MNAICVGTNIECITSMCKFLTFTNPHLRYFTTNNDTKELLIEKLQKYKKENSIIFHYNGCIKKFLHLLQELHSIINTFPNFLYIVELSEEEERYEQLNNYFSKNSIPVIGY